MPSLTSIPPELLSPILRLACADGGSTAHNLRLTCKALALETLPHHFRIVYLSEAAKLYALLRVIEEDGSRNSCQIKHIFITSHPMSKHHVPDHRFELVGKTIEDIEWTDLLQSQLMRSKRLGVRKVHLDATSPSPKDIPQVEFYESIACLLFHLSEHLESLTLVSYYPHDNMLDLCWTRLPSLRTLRLYIKGELPHSVDVVNMKDAMPVLNSITLGVPGSRFDKHWSFLHSVAACPSVHTVTLEGLVLSKPQGFSRLRRRFGAGSPDSMGPQGQTVQNEPTLKVSGIISSQFTGKVAVEDMLRKLQDIESAGIQLGSVRPTKLSLESALPALYDLKNAWLREMEEITLTDLD
jgi:hypothetical protein